MITLNFIMMGTVMTFVVNGVEIHYQFKDKAFKDKPLNIRCIPKDENFMKLLINSRNKIKHEHQMALIKMFKKLPEEEQKEYDETAPKGEDALADFVIKDANKNGLILLPNGRIKT